MSFVVVILREVSTGKERTSDRSNGACIADVRLRIARGTYVCSMSNGHTI